MAGQTEKTETWGLPLLFNCKRFALPASAMLLKCELVPKIQGGCMFGRVDMGSGARAWAEAARGTHPRNPSNSLQNPPVQTETGQMSLRKQSPLSFFALQAATEQESDGR